jgi:NADH-quinone oxidoreductase subunit M
MPAFAFFLGIYSLSSLAFPGTASFVGEFLCLSGAFHSNPWILFWVIPGALLAAAYMLRMLLILVWGQGGKREHAVDLSVREWICLAPPAVLVIVFGFYPAPLLEVMNPSLEALLDRVPVDESVKLSQMVGEYAFRIFHGG